MFSHFKLTLLTFLIENVDNINLICWQEKILMSSITLQEKKFVVMPQMPHHNNRRHYEE